MLKIHMPICTGRSEIHEVLLNTNPLLSDVKAFFESLKDKESFIVYCCICHCTMLFSMHSVMVSIR